MTSAATFATFRGVTWVSIGTSKVKIELSVPIAPARVMTVWTDCPLPKTTQTADVCDVQPVDRPAECGSIN